MQTRPTATSKRSTTRRAAFLNAGRIDVNPWLGKRTASPYRVRRKVGGNACHARNYGF